MAEADLHVKFVPPRDAVEKEGGEKVNGFGGETGFGVEAELDLPRNLGGLGETGHGPCALRVVLATLLHRALVQLK